MTGGHTQFWDKFNFRRDISRIIKAMWSNPLHQQAFIQSRQYVYVSGCANASDNFDQFIRFTNMLMSDTTFHLEESLTGLAKINSIEGQKANTEAWNALPQPERDDLVATLRQAESSTPFHTVMGLDHVELMRDLTATTREPFITGEIVDRLAAVSFWDIFLLTDRRWMRISLPWSAPRCRTSKSSIQAGSNSILKSF
jgi:ubiquitin conjugation factor E4 B